MKNLDALNELLFDCKRCSEGSYVDCDICPRKNAISALREREERMKGCKYCRGCTGVVLNVVEEKMAFGVGFNFCPMCGCKLKGADNG